jgi:hypothetical protein
LLFDPVHAAIDFPELLMAVLLLRHLHSQVFLELLLPAASGMEETGVAARSAL